MGFNIQEYLRENKINLGTISKEVGTSTPKTHNDIRKTNYDVKLDENGKLDLYTHKSVIEEHRDLSAKVSTGKKTNYNDINRITGISVNDIKEYIESNELDLDSLYNELCKASWEERNIFVKKVSESVSAINEYGCGCGGTREGGCKCGKHKSITEGKSGIVITRQGTDMYVNAASNVDEPTKGLKQLKRFSNLQQALNFANRTTKKGEPIEIYDKIGSGKDVRYQKYKKIKSNEDVNSSKIKNETKLSNILNISANK